MPRTPANESGIELEYETFGDAATPAVSGGEATGKAIPGAELIIVPGMGHDLAGGLLPLLLDALVTNFEKAGQL